MTGMMRAAWYDQPGAARDVLRVGELPVPEPGPGEVRVRVAASGLHAGDLLKRQGWFGATAPGTIPHGDGAGHIDAVGPGVSTRRREERVWVYLDSAARQYGTAAEYVVVPAENAVPLPAHVPFDQGAGLGIAGRTGHRLVFADGPVTGQTILVTGAAGAVGRVVVALARRGGATVIATVRSPGQADTARQAGAEHVIDTSGASGTAEDVSDEIMKLAPGGVHRVAEVAFSANIGLDVSVLGDGGVICTYSTSDAEPPIPYWPLGLKNLTIRFFNSSRFTAEQNRAAATDLTAAISDGDLRFPIAARFPLDRIAEAHERAEKQSGSAGRVVIEL